MDVLSEKTRPDTDKEDVILTRALADFERCQSAASENFQTYKDDIDFVLNENQWPDDVKKVRTADKRPMLTVNKLKAFAKQVINDARQNKPSVKVHPADSVADPETADVYNGLIRNIEYASSADVAYDTGAECAVNGGFGYWRVTLDYAYDDTFDMDIGIERVLNPLSILGDPHSTAADSSDWNVAFVTDWLSNKEFEAEYGDKAKVNWKDDASWSEASAWRDEDGVMVAEYWTREKVDRPIVLLSNGQVRGAEELAKDEETQALLATGEVKVLEKRVAKSCKVTQRIMSGVEILAEREWPGKFIPIIPVYGDEFNIDGKRYFRSLVHSAIDPQRMHNYWRSNATEMVALAPRAPWIGPKGAFLGPQWKTANTRNHAFLEYDPKVVKDAGMVPQRQPLDMGAAAGSLQEALNASDDIKATIGMYDASLGARSNETSGKAILARQREGDVATYHFVDNMARSIRHTGRVLIDIIPKVYTKERIIRVIGEDGKQDAVPLNQPVPMTNEDDQPVVDPETGEQMTRVYDLSLGKYDLTVTTGPSFTTRREEAAQSMGEAIQAYPAAAPVILPRLAKNLDWPEADDIARDLEKLSPLNQQQIPPELQQQIDEGMKRMQELEAENQQLKSAAQDGEQKIASDERMKALEIEAEERTAKLKIESDARVKAYAAQIQANASIAIAQAKPAPQPAQ